MHLLLLVLAVVILVGAVIATRAGRGHPPSTSRPARVDLDPTGAEGDESMPVPATVRRSPGGGFSPMLGRWVKAGLITWEQSAEIQRFETAREAGAAPERPARVSPLRSARVPVVAEALGYLGATLATTGLMLVIAHLWTDLALAGRLGISGVAAVLLVVAGALVHETADPALARLRWVLWLAATAAAVVFAGVLADGVGAESPEAIAASCAATAAVVSGVLWGWRERPLQQAVALGAVPAAIGTAALLLLPRGAAYFLVWGVGAVLFALGVRLLTPLPWVTETVGALTLLAGSTLVASDWEGRGLLFVLFTGAALVAVAIVGSIAPTGTGQVIAGSFGAVALVQGLPPTIGWFSQDAGVLTGLVLWATGVGLVVVGATHLTRLPLVVEILGGVLTVGGAAVCGTQSPGFAAAFGVANAVALIGAGMRPGRVLLSAVGAVGLLVNVPWAMGWFFPGENRAPLLIMVSGALIIAVAVLMTRQAGRFRSEIGHPHPAR